MLKSIIFLIKYQKSFPDKIISHSINHIIQEIYQRYLEIYLIKLLLFKFVYIYIYIHSNIYIYIFQIYHYKIINIPNIIKIYTDMNFFIFIFLSENFCSQVVLSRRYFWKWWWCCSRRFRFCTFNGGWWPIWWWNWWQTNHLWIPSCCSKKWLLTLTNVLHCHYKKRKHCRTSVEDLTIFFCDFSNCI